MCVGDCRQVVVSASFASVSLKTLLDGAEAQDTFFGGGLKNLKDPVAFLP